MTTIAILPGASTRSGKPCFDAVASDQHASGDTIGSAIDALNLKMGQSSHPSLVVVQPMVGDEFFGDGQIATLQHLMGKWRESRDGSAKLDPASAQELADLVDAELSATIQRCQAAHVE